MHRVVSILLTVSLVPTLSGCDLWWYGTAGEMSVDVSSASLPEDRFAEVLVVLESVSAVSVTGEIQWLVADHKPALDLMSLHSQPARIVRGAELPRGHYSTIFLSLAPTAEVMMVDGGAATLQVVPQDTLIEIPEFDFDDGREWVELRLTFDVSASLRDILADSTSEARHFSPEVLVSSLAFGDRR